MSIQVSFGAQLTNLGAAKLLERDEKPYEYENGRELAARAYARKNPRRVLIRQAEA